MIIDGNQLADETQRHYDICIVGSGPAGITLARQLAGPNCRVCVLEAGEDKYTESSQAFYQGDITAESYDDLDVARLRLFGGTSGHWAGYCSTLDPIDFSERDWIPNSGWPITLTDLSQHYEKARDILDLPDERVAPQDTLHFTSNAVTSKRWAFSPPTRFADKYRDWFASADNADLYLNTTVVSFKHSIDGRRVERLTSLNHDQNARSFSAGTFILACGGIENPRLLLTGSPVFAKQPGGEHIGRYFMEHPHFLDAGEVALKRSSALASYERSRGHFLHCLQVSPEWQRQLKLNNMACELRALPPGEKLPAGIYGASGERHHFSLVTMIEQTPNRASRVTLSDRKDANGIPRVDLQWRTNQGDYESCMASLKFLSTQLGRSDIGRLRLSRKTIEGRLHELKYWGHHHMGTTRMSSSPKTGVTDANCRLHGTENFYIAGSSLYPTVGCANPTFTLVALALRLADHLRVTPSLA